MSCITFWRLLMCTVLYVPLLLKVVSMAMISSGSKTETRGSHAPPLREETAINKAHKLLLEGAKITETPWKWPWTTKNVGPSQKNSLDRLLAMMWCCLQSKIVVSIHTDLIPLSYLIQKGEKRKLKFWPFYEISVILMIISRPRLMFCYIIHVL